MNRETVKKKMPRVKTEQTKEAAAAQTKTRWWQSSERETPTTPTALLTSR